MNFFSRSSRATGPKTRVPDRLPLVGDQDRGVVVEPDVGAVLAPVVAARADDDRPHDALAVLLDERRIRARPP